MVHLKKHAAFLQDANQVHKGRYDYTKDIYMYDYM